MYAGLGPDERPKQGASPYPFLTLVELSEFIAKNEVPESFVRHCMFCEIRWVSGHRASAQYLSLRPRLLDMICLIRRRVGL